MSGYICQHVYRCTSMWWSIFIHAHRQQHCLDVMIASTHAHRQQHCVDVMIDIYTWTSTATQCWCVDRIYRCTPQTSRANPVQCCSTHQKSAHRQQHCVDVLISSTDAHRQQHCVDVHLGVSIHLYAHADVWNSIRTCRMRTATWVWCIW